MENKAWLIFKSNRVVPESETTYDKLSVKNKKVLDSWLHEKSILSKSEKRAGNRKRAIIKLLDFIGKDFDKITYEDYVSIASALSKSKNGIKQSNGDRYFIKRFLQDNFEDCEKKFKGFKLLKLEIEGEDKKLSAKELLTELEIDKMMRATSDMKKISLIAVLSVSGARPEELLKLRWCDVDFSKNLVYLYSGKTKKKRVVPIGSAINHLKRLKGESRASDNDLLFPSVRGNKIITIAGLNFMLKDLAQKSKIKKRVWAYLFRHTRLSFLITKLSPKVYEEVAGHSLQMGMRNYAHLSQDKIIQEMKENVFKIEELKPEEKDRLALLEEKIRRLEKALPYGLEDGDSGQIIWEKVI